MARIRSTPQRDMHRAMIAELTLKGKKCFEIAERLNISPATVSRDLAFLRAEWRAQTQVAIAEQIAIEVAKLNLVEEVHWDAWEETKDPRHLNGVVSCIQRRCDLMLGLDVARKSNGQFEYDPISRARDQLINKLASFFTSDGTTAIIASNQGDE